MNLSCSQKALYVKDLIVTNKEKYTRSQLAVLLGVSERTINRIISDINCYYRNTYQYDKSIIYDRSEGCYILDVVK